MVRSDYVEIDIGMLLKVGFILALTVWGVMGALHDNAFLFLHGIDLLIHEVGHPLFGIFGYEPLMVLGGTLLQLAMPIAFTGYFLQRKEYYSSAVVLFWVTQNFFDVAVYMRDARALALPLVSIGGGDGDVIHDWNYLFDQWGVLANDQSIAAVTAGIGWGLLVIVLLAGVYFSITNELPSFRRDPETTPSRPPKNFKFE